MMVHQRCSLSSAHYLCDVCPQAFHAAGLVHRDIKPLNIILADDTKHIKIIDLGACADLRSGTNYVPDESILDLNYCPPEQVRRFTMTTCALMHCQENHA